MAPLSRADKLASVSVNGNGNGNGMKQHTSSDKLKAGARKGKRGGGGQGMGRAPPVTRPPSPGDMVHYCHDNMATKYGGT